MIMIPNFFFYAGYCHHTHFYIHHNISSINGSEFTSMIGQLYPVMINETMIKYNDKIVVFSFFGEEITVVIINHCDFPAAVYPEQQLKIVLKKLTEADRSGQLKFVIKFDGHVYETYELDMEIPKLESCDIDTIKFKTIHNIICNKSINYRLQ
ncbi:hypothetical protein [Niemeyer virus]|nr:hypothetical protein [Niemeyer virus]